MIQKVQTGSVHMQWMESLKKSKIHSDTFIFVPSHACVWGSERADRLAGSATINSGQPMDFADIGNELREFGRAEDFEREDLTSLSVVQVEGEEWHRRD